jgi:hypothetical protein
MIDDKGSLAGKWRLAARAAADPGLKAPETRLLLIVLEAIDRQTGACDYAVQTMADRVRAPASRTRTMLAALARAGYLTIEPRGGKVTPKGPTNRYRPIYATGENGDAAEGTESSPRVINLRGRNRPPEPAAGGTKPLSAGGTDSSPTPIKSFPLREGGAFAPAADEENGKHPPRQTGKPPLPSPEEAAKIADEFWTRYPASHRKEDRRGVTRKIIKLLTTGEATGADLLAGLAAYAKSPDALKGGKGEWVKAPMVFLNKETWRAHLAQGGNGAVKIQGPLAITSAADAARIYDVGAG